MLDMARGDENRAQRDLTTFELSCAILTCAYCGGHRDLLYQASFFGTYFSFCFCLYLASLSKRRQKGNGLAMHWGFGKTRCSKGPGVLSSNFQRKMHGID